MIATASTYFLPGPNGEPPMFGPDGFAREATPKNSEGLMLGLCSCCGDWCYLTEGAKRGRDTPEAAADRCAIAAQGWIRSKGVVVTVFPCGRISLAVCKEGTALNTFYDPPRASQMNVLFGKDFEPIDGSPDWLAAARWVNEQTKEKA